jgi:hypothetical protein
VKFLKALGTELVWLAGSYAAAFGALWALGVRSTLDIQMHNTYFVLSAPVAAVPVFAGLAAIGTAGRLASGRFRTPYTTAVLLGLALLWAFIMAIVLWIIAALQLQHVR